jgi:membrane fusion protein, multidrug efflux system
MATIHGPWRAQDGTKSMSNGDLRGAVAFPVDSQVVVDVGGTRDLSPRHSAFPQPVRRDRHWLRWIVIGITVTAIILAGLRYLKPAVEEMLRTVSTDDAFVSGHVTNVSPRIGDVVTEVLVDQDDRVEPGQLLIRLDREPFALTVAQSKAALEEARANLASARAQVKAQIAQARGNWYRRQNAVERLRQQEAALRARVAALHARESSRWLAEVDQRRIEALVKQNSASQSELDQRNNTLKVAREQEQEAWAEVQETRAVLGLAPNYRDPLDIPKDLEVQQSTVQTAVSDIAAALAQVGIPFDPKDAAQASAFGDFLRPRADKSAGEGMEKIVDQAPAVSVARAAVVRAERQLDDANLRLSYTEIRSEIAGYIQDRSVHPGNQVQTGQTLLSIRPDYVWIEANYKETQVRYIRIGMPVDLHVDAYPNRVFKGRVAGFSPGTGLSESLLPPENATGNYVKVTQRLPVRIELVEPNPRDTPLFVGLSVVPYVRFEEKPTGPEAGQRLRTFDHPAPPDVGAGPVGIQSRNRGESVRTSPR